MAVIVETGVARGRAGRVLFWARPDLRDEPGGDTEQVLQTARHLREAGVEVVVSFARDEDLAPYDLVHLWHLERVHDTFCYLPLALAAGKPVVLSTIYWPPGGEPRRLTGAAGAVLGLRENLKLCVRLACGRSPEQRARARVALARGWRGCRRQLLTLPRVLLPNSEAEAHVLAAEAGGGARAVVVPNGIDPQACRMAAAAPAPPAPGTEGELVCVGHFCPRKNQLWLIRALAGGSHRLTFIGGARPMHRRYHRRCLAMAAGRHVFTGPLDRERVLGAMRRARVHVCASLLETPGLVNLEAAVMGCNLVVPECPPVREYLGGDAFYFTPGDAASLLRTLDEALRAPPPTRLRERILSRFTWGQAAKATIMAYELALADGA